MEKLITYVRTVHAQIEQLLDPRKPEPTTEQLQGFVSKVVQSLKNMTAQAPPAVKEKITLSFAKHWNVAENKVGEAGITPLDLAACMSAIKDELKKLTEDSRLMNKGKPTGEEAPKKHYGGETVTDVKILEDKAHVARIIGPQGSILQGLQNEFSVKLDIANEMVNITGPKDGVDACMKAITDILTKGYASFTFGDDFAEEKLKINPRQVADLVGPGWQNVNAIKAKLNVEIGILDAPKPGTVLPKTGPASKQQQKKATVVIGGHAGDVKKARVVIEQLLTKFYHEITHPDMIMKEIECDPWYLNMVIGRGGSEIKHMQNSWGVKVYIPSETNGNENIVVVGHESSVQKTEKHIASILWSAANKPQRGEERFGGGDDGDDDVEEAWMADYMYKR